MRLFGHDSFTDDHTHTHTHTCTRTCSPFSSKYFLSIGDWTARVWTDDIAVKTPILTTKYHPTYLTGGGHALLMLMLLLWREGLSPCCDRAEEGRVAVGLDCSRAGVQKMLLRHGDLLLLLLLREALSTIAWQSPVLMCPDCDFHLDPLAWQHSPALMYLSCSSSSCAHCCLATHLPLHFVHHLTSAWQ